MSSPDLQEELAERYLQKMLEATFPLHQGPDHEVTLHALIRAAELLKKRFERELDERRQEQD